MGRRVIVTLRYVQEIRDRYGKLRRYYRRPGYPRVPLPGEPGSREFMAAYEDAAAGARPKLPNSPLRDPRTAASAVSLYLGSDIFTQLAPDTRRTRRNELERFRVEHGHRELARIDARAIESMVRKKRPVPGRNFLKALSPFLDWCVGGRMIETNPAKAVKRPTTPNKDGYKTWPEEFVAQYRAHHKIGTKPRLAIEVIVNTGAARIDAAQLGRQHVKGGLLTYRRHKTNVPVRIPILPDLAAALEAAERSGGLSFIAKDDGTAYTKESFGNYFRQWCDDAGIPKGYSAHGLRKYAAKVRAEAGATVNELMAWFGWLSEREATRYTRDADRLRMALELGRKMGG